VITRNFLVVVFPLLLGSVPATAGNVQVLTGGNPLSRGLDLAARKYPEAAAAQFRRCNDLTSATSHQLMIVAKTYFDAGETTNSLKVIDYALSQDRVKCEKGDKAGLLDLRGTILAYLNCRDEAVSSYKLAAAASPGLSYIYLPKAGQELIKLKRYKEALPLLEKGLKPGTMTGFVYQDIGHCYLELGAPTMAVAPLIASIDVFDAFRKHQSEAYLPGLIQSHKYLVKAYEATSNYKEAAVRRKRLNSLIGGLDEDFFGGR
jgi:tetratricopeptide (TPR) repeat protein